MIKQSDHVDENGFWAGAGGGASGILPICRTTKRICLAWRSINVMEGDCWGTLGGAIQKGRTPAESAQIEMAEETGYHGAVELHPAFVFTSGTFKYHNFLGIVDEEFTFHPQDEHSWETDFIEWHDLADIQADIKNNPNDFHPGLVTLFKQSRLLIKRLIGAQGPDEKTAAYQSQGHLKELVDYLQSPSREMWIIFAERFPDEWEEMNGDEVAPYEADDAMLYHFFEMNHRYMIQDDPKQTPAVLVLDYEKTIPNAWGVHFTNHALAIARDGFTRGLSDVNDLAATTWHGDEEKKGPGYAFAFSLDTSADFIDKISRLPETATYGKQAVIVKADAALVNHTQDQYWQLIFWGSDAKVRIPVVRKGPNWVALSPEGAKLFAAEKLTEIATWAKTRRKRTAAKKEDPSAEYVEDTNGYALFPNEREGFYGVAPIKEMVEGGHKWADAKVAYNEEAHQQGRYEYAGRWHENETDEQGTARRQRSAEWDQSILAAISLGKFDPKEADNRKYLAMSLSGKFADAFKPLPQTLYHVTTAKSKVRSGLLLSRYELQTQNGLGLGGGDDKSISFTEDLDIAEGIYSALIEARRVASGEFTVQQMLDLAAEGAGAKRPWITEFIRWAGGYRCHNEWSPGEPLPEDMQAILEGKKIVSGSFLDPKTAEQMKAEGLEPVGEGWQGRDHHYWATFKRPMTEKEKQDIEFDQFKVYCYAREDAGGALNPVFFSSDVAGLSGVSESEIAILKFKPIPGAMGTQESALGEWRTYSGKAVTFQGVVPPHGVKTAGLFSTAAEYGFRRTARPSDAKIEMLTKQLKLSPEQIEMCIAADPSPNQTDFITWLGKNLSKGNITLPEDGERIKGQLDTFQKLKRSPTFTGNKDINSYDPSQLFDVLEANSSEISKKEQGREEIIKGAEVVVEQDGIRVYKVTDVKAERRLSSGTNWCTAQQHFAERYLKQGPIYPIFEDGHAYAQLHPASNQLRDRRDFSLVESFTPMQYGSPQNKVYFVYDSVVLKALKLLSAKEPDVKAWMAANISPSVDVRRALKNSAGNNLESRVKLALLAGKPLPRTVEALLGDKVEYSLLFKYGSRFHAGQPWAPLEVAMIKGKVPYKALVDYAVKFLKARWPEAETKMLRFLATSSDASPAAVEYAVRVIKGRWPELEAKIKKTKPNELIGEAAYWYAHDVLKARWPQEPLAKKERGGPNMSPAEYAMCVSSPVKAAEYCKLFVKGPWPEMAALLLTPPEDATADYHNSIQARIAYQAEVVGGRDSALEEVLFTYGGGEEGARNAMRYVNTVVKGRWPELEAGLLTQVGAYKQSGYGHGYGYGYDQNSYGGDIAREGWFHPNALSRLAQDYLKEVIKARWPELERVLLDRYTKEGSAWNESQKLIIDYLYIIKTYFKTDWPEGQARLKERCPAYESSLLAQHQATLDRYEVDKQENKPENRNRDNRIWFWEVNGLKEYLRFLKKNGMSWPEGLAAARQNAKLKDENWEPDSIMRNHAWTHPDDADIYAPDGEGAPGAATAETAVTASHEAAPFRSSFLRSR